MVYFISSTTKWPSDKRNSVFLRYLKKEEYIFGNVNHCSFLIVSVRDDMTSLFFDKKLSNHNFTVNDIGETICSDIIFSSSVLSENTFYSENYKNRALNIIEYMEQDDECFWEDFSILIKLVFLEMKRIKTYTEAIFINLSFFPNSLMKDLRYFYTKLFSILNQYPDETFVIIVERKSVRKLSFFDKFYKEHVEDFTSEIIVRVNYTAGSRLHGNTYQLTQALNNDIGEFHFEYDCFWTQTIKNKFLDSIKRFRETDTKTLLESRFYRITDKYAKKDNYYATYRNRLLSSFVKTYDVKFSSFKSVDKFYKNYLYENMKNKSSAENFQREKKNFYRCFQRYPFGLENFDGNITFNVDNINKKQNQKDISSWSRLSNKMVKCHFLKWEHKDDYNKIKYFCGKTLSGNKYLVPANNDIFKEFLFQVGICAELSFEDIERLLKMYGFAFVRFSLKDLLYNFLIKETGCSKPEDKGLVYQLLKELILSPENPIGL